MHRSTMSILFASLLAVGCGGGGGGDHDAGGNGGDQDAGAAEPCMPGASASFSADVQPILAASCLGAACHAGTRPAGDLDLEVGRAYDELVGVPSTCPDHRTLVQPGDPSASYLIAKLTGVGICQGSRMPLTGAGLSPAQIATLRAWICAGAPND